MPAIAIYTINKSTSYKERQKINKTIFKKLENHKVVNKTLYQNKVSAKACSNLPESFL